MLLDTFNNDEKIILNKISEGTKNNELTSELVCSELTLLKSFSADADISDVLSELLKKVSGLKDEDWEHIRSLFPLPTDYDTEDIDQEV